MVGPLAVLFVPSEPLVPLIVKVLLPLSVIETEVLPIAVYQVLVTLPEVVCQSELFFVAFCIVHIFKLTGIIQQKGYTLVPISIYFKNNRVKLELGICKGKKLFDKREDLKKKEADKKIQIAMREKNL